MTADLDTLIIEIVRKRGRADVRDIINDLYSDYHLNYTRDKVRKHAQSLSNFRFLKRKPMKSDKPHCDIVYVYEVVD